MTNPGSEQAALLAMLGAARRKRTRRRFFAAGTVGGVAVVFGIGLVAAVVPMGSGTATRSSAIERGIAVVEKPAASPAAENDARAEAELERLASGASAQRGAVVERVVHRPGVRRVDDAELITLLGSAGIEAGLVRRGDSAVIVDRRTGLPLDLSADAEGAGELDAGE